MAGLAAKGKGEGAIEENGVKYSVDVDERVDDTEVFKESVHAEKEML